MVKRIHAFVCFLCFLLAASTSAAMAQNNSKSEILSGDSLKRIVPTSFYFAGQSAETQMRNAAAAKIGENRYVIAGLVDTSGYSAEISGKYEGFFITDSLVNIGDKTLDTGAYGFGFSKEGKVNFFDLSSKEILSVATINDAEMKRPRPLLMTSDAKGIRLYKGKNYVLISAR
jgi:hypothetical protein